MGKQKRGEVIRRDNLKIFEKNHTGTYYWRNFLKLINLFENYGN